MQVLFFFSVHKSTFWVTQKKSKLKLNTSKFKKSCIISISWFALFFFSVGRISSPPSPSLLLRPCKFFFCRSATLLELNMPNTRPGGSQERCSSRWWAGITLQFNVLYTNPVKKVIINLCWLLNFLTELYCFKMQDHQQKL